LLSQCRKSGITPSANLGSIGVYSIIEDYTKALEQQGIKKEAIFSGKFKLLGADFRAITDEERAILQEDINLSHNKFKQAILSKRNVKDEYMQGLMYEGDLAKEANLTDVVVYNLNEFLTSTNIIDMNKTIKINKTVAKEATAPDLTKKAEDLKKEEKDLVPGVPEAKEELVKKEEDKPKDKTEEDKEEVKKEEAKYDGQYCLCPSCSHTWKLEAKHMKKMEEEDKPQDKTEEDKEEEKTEEVDKKDDKTVEEVEKEQPKEQPKEEPKEDLSKKKAKLPSNAEWFAHFGIKHQANKFVEASYAFLNQSNKK
jgi:ClpP class serine protease